MRPYRYTSSVEQLAAHLRGEIHRGELIGEMPGVDRLAATLGCSQRTVLGALKLLEHEGLLVKQGAGRPSRITPETWNEARSLLVAILLGLPEDIRLDYIVDLQHQLDKEGHSVIFPSRSLSEMKLDLKRVSRLVSSTKADAWVLEGATREVLTPENAWKLLTPRASLPKVMRPLASGRKVRAFAMGRPCHRREKAQVGNGLFPTVTV